MVMLPCLFILKRTRPSEEEVRPTVEGDRRGKLYPNEVTRRCTGTLTREGELGRTNGIGEMEDFAARAARVGRGGFTCVNHLGTGVPLLPAAVTTRGSAPSTVTPKSGLETVGDCGTAGDRSRDGDDRGERVVEGEAVRDGESTAVRSTFTSFSLDERRLHKSCCVSNELFSSSTTLFSFDARFAARSSFVALVCPPPRDNGVALRPEA